jgi:hypothetical protein
MVLSVQGDVKLRRMDLLRPGERVAVPAQGSVRLVFLADGHTETLKAGTTVRITEAGGAPTEAVTREKSKLPEGQLDGLRSLAASARAGVARLRDFGPLPLAPIHGATVRDDRPTFVWRAVPGAAGYDVQLFRGDTDRPDNLVRSVRVGKDQLPFPKEWPSLGRGATYTWKVLAGGKEVVAKGRLNVATKEQVRECDRLQKLADGKDVPDRLLAAMLFEAEEVYDESHRLFERLVKELPEEPWIALALARHLGRLGRSEEALSLEKKALALAAKAR